MGYRGMTHPGEPLGGLATAQRERKRKQQQRGGHAATHGARAASSAPGLRAVISAHAPAAVARVWRRGAL